MVFQTPASALAAAFTRAPRACSVRISKAFYARMTTPSFRDPDGTFAAPGDVKRLTSRPRLEVDASTTPGDVATLPSPPRDAEHHGHYEKTSPRITGRPVRAYLTARQTWRTSSRGISLPRAVLALSSFYGVGGRSDN